MRRAFELDAARTDVELGIGATWHGMETTAFDGTSAEVFNNDVLAEAFGVPAGGTKPKVRIVAHVRTGSRRWIAAATGSRRAQATGVSRALSRRTSPCRGPPRAARGPPP